MCGFLPVMDSAIVASAINVARMLVVICVQCAGTIGLLGNSTRLNFKLRFRVPDVR